MLELPAQRALYLLLIPLVLAGRANGQDPNEAAPPRTQLRRSDHAGLWPFYSREAYEDGSVRHSVLFGAFRGEWRPNGDFHHRLLPLYSSTLQDDGTDRQLALFPLLYLMRRSPASDFDIVLPFFARWRTPAAGQTLLWPLYHQAHRSGTAPFRSLPVLLARGRWEGGSQARLGVPYALDLFEYTSDSTLSAWTLGVLFPWGPPARFGLPLAKYRRTTAPSWHFHLFPLVGAGKGEVHDDDYHYVHTPLYGTWKRTGGERGHGVPPLLAWWSRAPEKVDVHAIAPLFRYFEDPERELLRVFPFYIRESRPQEGERDDYLPLLLSRYGSGPKREEIDVLWPFFHLSRRGEAGAVRLLPFYDRKVSPERNAVGIGGVLYRRHEDRSADSVTHWVLWPLGRWTRSPEASTTWILPVFYDFESETEKRRTALEIVAPLYWSRRVDVRFEDDWRLSSRWLHLWPFYGFSERRPSPRGSITRTHHTLAPFFSISRTTDPKTRRITKSEVDLFWPFIEKEWSPEGWAFRVFPTLFTGSGTSRAYFYLYPLLSVESGDSARSNFWSYTSLVHWYDNEAGEDAIRMRRFQVFPMLFHWSREGDTDRITGPLWSFHYRRSPDSGWCHLAPLGFGAWEGERTRAGIFPLYYRRAYGSDPINYWFPGRFFFFWNSLRSEREAYDSVLWKTVEYTRTPGGDYDFRILHRLFVNREVRGQREIVVNPLFGWTRDARKDTSTFSVLKFLYRSETAAGSTTGRLLGIPIWRSH